jgi:hypothetical protein
LIVYREGDFLGGCYEGAPGYRRTALRFGGEPSSSARAVMQIGFYLKPRSATVVVPKSRLAMEHNISGGI